MEDREDCLVKYNSVCSVKLKILYPLVFKYHTEVHIKANIVLNTSIINSIVNTGVCSFSYENTNKLKEIL